MKKNLLWSLVAATAMMTGCSDDVTTDNSSQILTGEKVPVSFAINVGGAISTYATESNLGGWTNLKNDADMQSAYDYRAIVQVFAQEGEDAKPIAEVRKTFSTVPAEGANIIQLDDLRLPVSNTYTAVVWVDFVADGVSTTTAERNDLFYDTENLKSVKVLGLSPFNLANSPEARDAYTGSMTFTVNADGTYQPAASNGDAQGNSVALNVMAQRPFGKVRIILTDWDNHAQWKQYFEGQAADRIMQAISMKVKGMVTSYNALTGEPVFVAGAPAFEFDRSWGNVSYDEDDANANGMSWIEKNGKSYPALDCNYFIPVSNTDAASYPIEIDIYAEAEKTTLISHRSFASIPVKKNCLTTVLGNFLTTGYNFKVKVDDLATGGSSSTVVEDDGINTSIVDSWGTMKAQVSRKANGDITGIVVPSVANGNFDKEQFDLTIREIKKLGNIAGATVTFNAAAFPADVDFASLAVTAINVNLNGTALAQETAMSNLTSNVVITNSVTQTKKLTVTSTADVTIGGAATYGALTLAGGNINISATGTIAGEVIATATTGKFKITGNNAIYSKTITVTAATSEFGGNPSTTYNEVITIKAQAGATVAINNGKFNNNFNTAVNTTVSGGLMNTDIDGITGLYKYSLQMMSTTPLKLDIQKTGSAFGALSVEYQNKHSLNFINNIVQSLYGNYAAGVWNSITVDTIIN